MPKLKTETIFLPNGKKFRMEYNFKDDAFNISLPRDYRRLFPEDDSYVVAATVQQVKTLFFEKIGVWKKAKTFTRKVIGYCFYTNRVSRNKNGSIKRVLSMDLKPDHFTNHKKPDLTPDSAVGFVYEVAFERTVVGKKTYFTIDDDPFEDEEECERGTELLSNYSNEGIVVVAWTQERQDFMRTMESTIGNIAKQAWEFEKNTRSEKKLESTLKKIKQGNVLALTSGGGEQKEKP